jgi:tetratricopeptide (TPR) repeat protein
MLGIAFAGLGEFETSNGHFERAIAINPNGVGGYFYWARELLKRGRTVESEAVMGTARRNVQKVIRASHVHVESDGGSQIG